MINIFSSQESLIWYVAVVSFIFPSVIQYLLYLSDKNSQKKVFDDLKSKGSYLGGAADFETYYLGAGHSSQKIFDFIFRNSVIPLVIMTIFKLTSFQSSGLYPFLLVIIFLFMIFHESYAKEKLKGSRWYRSLIFLVWFSFFFIINCANIKIALSDSGHIKTEETKN